MKVLKNIASEKSQSSIKREADAQKFVHQRTEELSLAIQEANDKEERISAILNNVVDGIITIDDQGNIETFNPAAERIFGYAADEVIGQNVNCLMPQPCRSEHDGYQKTGWSIRVAKILGGGREVIGRHKDGSTFPMELSIGAMRVGSTEMFTGIVRDITDRKQAEKVKTEFISMVSHELRTPLTSIKGALGLIKSGAAGDFPKKLGRMLDIAYNNSDRLVRLINDILDIEKIADGMIGIKMEPIDVEVLLKQAIEANRGYGQEYGVNFSLSCDLSEAFVEGDQDRLMQVLCNLMSNAAKFSPEGELVVISLSAHNGNYRIAVTDRGPGIPADFRDKIFGRFYQADSSDTRQKGGTGLGLNITKSIVERHGGTIGFETEVGEGTTFFFDLPVMQEREAVYVSALANEYRNHVLICENNADVSTLIKMMLTQDGYTSDIAKTAAEAEELLATNSYDAMTLEIGLPGKDSINLLKELRGNPKTRALPIIIISATAGTDAKGLNGDAIGIIDWIVKPIDQNRVSEALRQAIPNSRYGHARILHVEDNPDILQIIASLVGSLAQVVPARTLAMAKSILERQSFDLVILDMVLPDGNGEDLLPLLTGHNHKSIPVIVFTAIENPCQTTDNIKAVLTKSKTTNADLLATIRSSIECANRSSIGRCPDTA